MEDRYTIHLIGNAHLDPVWLWRWQEGFAEIKATFRSALDRLEEFPEFIFTCACAAYYKWVEENCPEMFEEIKERIKEGLLWEAGGFSRTAIFLPESLLYVTDCTARDIFRKNSE